MSCVFKPAIRLNVSKTLFPTHCFENKVSGSLLETYIILLSNHLKKFTKNGTVARRSCRVYTDNY